MNEIHSIRLSGDQAAALMKIRLSDRDTVVLELLQHAYRAGASAAHVSYDGGTGTLVVSHDGAGIKDFAILAKIDACNWTTHLRANEQPYGLSFLAAVYSAAQVQVLSNGTACDVYTDKLLAGETFAVTRVPGAEKGTSVTLTKVFWPDGANRVRRMVAGFPIPVHFNGERLPRPDALDGNSGVTGHNGTYILRSEIYSMPQRAYLRGVCVYRHDCAHGGPEGVHNVVHLDPRMYQAGFADRYRIIDSEAMFEAVKAETKGLYVERLMDMKRSLQPLQFCEQAYDLARSVQRVGVFDDVDVVPASWLGIIDVLPCTPLLDDSSESPLDLSRDELVRSRTSLSRQEVESGHVVIARVSDFNPWANVILDGETNQLACTLAYAMKALCIKRYLCPEHWLCRAACIDDASEVVVKVNAPGLRGEVGQQAHRIAGAGVLLCESVELSLGEIRVTLNEPFFAMEGGDAVALVPCRDGHFQPATQATVRQYDSYIEGGGFLDREAQDDADEINGVVRVLMAQTPEARLALVLRAALANHAESHGQHFEVDVSASGEVKVLSLAPLAQIRAAP